MTMKKRMFGAFVFGLSLFFLCALGPVQAAETPKVTKLKTGKPGSSLYIGNSFFYYNNGITNAVRYLVTAYDEKIKRHIRLVGIGGSGLSWHDVESYFRPNAIGSYTFLPDNSIQFNESVDKLFDVTVMVDCSQCPIHPDLKPLFYEYAKKHSETIRKHNSEPVLFMSWAYKDRPEMTQQLADEYTRAGNANDLLVIPAGLAFAEVMKQRPDVDLYMVDKRHPTAAGTYLSACVAFSSLYQASPVGLDYFGGLDADTAKFLQEVAWNTTQAYYKE